MSQFYFIAPAALALAFSSTGRSEDKTASPHHVSANTGLYSQYVFRGLTQTNERPALQGGFDYAHDSGFYLGTWASNISWFSDLNPGNSVSLEWDFYGGVKKTWPSGLITDVGYLRYEYPGSYPALSPGVFEPNTDEIYAALSWKWANLKYSYAVSDLFGVPDSDGSAYLDLTLTIPLPQSLSLALHAGQQKFSGRGNDRLFGYEDYRLTLSYGFPAGWTAAASFTHTSAQDAGYTVLGKNLGDDQFILSMTRAL